MKTPKNKAKPFFILLLVALLFAVVFGPKLIGFFGVEDLSQAPNIQHNLVNGQPFELKSLKGQLVLLEFWASWCGPCRPEMQKLSDLHQKAGNTISIVSIALEKSENHPQAAAQKLGINWRYQMIEKTPIVLASPLARLYGVAEIPAKFLIYPDGKLKKNPSWEEIEIAIENIKP